MSQVATKKILFAFRHAPYGNNLARDGIDAVLAASVYDQALSVLFMDDGIFQLTRQQNSVGIEEKNIEQLLSAFELYDIHQIYVCSDSLAIRGMTVEDLNMGGELLSTEEVHQLFTEQDHILSF